MHPSAGIHIPGPRLLLRPLRPEEVDAEWQAMVASDPMAITQLPDEARFRARLAWSGEMRDGWLDLAITLEDRVLGRIQTFVPPNQELPPGTYWMGIGLRETVRGQGHGSEALAVLTDWLFEHAGAEIVAAPTDPENRPMRAVFERVGWREIETFTDYDRPWVMYRVTRGQWLAARG
jgi:RimJ/RimL family protein N-acetyltransferase